MPSMSDTGTPEVVEQATPATPLEQAAELWGIEREFWDIWGKHHETPPETQKGVLKSLGVDTSSEQSIQRAISERIRRDWTRPLASTIVIGDHTPLEIPVHIPQDMEN